MSKVKTKLLMLLAAVAMIFAIAGIAACTGSTYTVTFMAYDFGSSEWKIYTTVDTESDSVALPSDPDYSDDGYNFTGWFKDTSFTSSFTGSGVTADLTVYAGYSETSITGYVLDETGEIKTIGAVSVATLDALTAKYEQAAADVNLTFDGWYLDGSFSTAYVGQDIATLTLYGRYMAQIVYNNGYQDCYSELVLPGSTASAPAYSDFDTGASYYMDEELLYYYDADGVKIDFTTQTFTVNTTVTIRWQTVGWQQYVSKIDNSNYYQIVLPAMPEGISNYPVISFLGSDYAEGTIATVDMSKVNKTNTVTLDAVIFNEGIAYINGLEGNSLGGATTTTVVLPQSLRILESSFNYLPQVQINLPSGLEVIIDCFWADTSLGSYDFDIEIPSSVVTMVSVPVNLTFAAGSAFIKTNGAIFKAESEGNVLVSYYKTDDGLLDLTSYDFYAVQAGIFDGVSFTRIAFPSTFCEVAYSADYRNYSSYYTGTMLYNGDYTEDYLAGSGMNVRVYSLISDMDNMEYVILNCTSYPSTLSQYAFTNSAGTATKDLYTAKVIFVGSASAGESVTVNITYKNTMASSDSGTTTLTSYVSGDELGIQAILTAVADDLGTGDTFTLAEGSYDTFIDAGSNNYKINYIQAISYYGVGYEFTDGSTLPGNIYIEISYEYANLGITYTLNSDKSGYIVTGLDADNAAIDTDSGGYIVIIPDEIDGIPVVEIAEKAFENQTKIVTVYIGANVTTINAYAFSYTSALCNVYISAGNLSRVESYAFYQAGAYYDSEAGDYTYDTSSGLAIQIPLANLTYIGSYAFKSPAIVAFTAVEGEESRTMFNMTAGATITYTDTTNMTEEEKAAVSGSLNVSYNDGASTYIVDESSILSCLTVKEGDYVFAYYSTKSGQAGYAVILRYMGYSIAADESGSKTTVDTIMYNMQLVAVAGGSTAASGTVFTVGTSARNMFMATTMTASAHTMYHSYETMSFEVLEGSVYYLQNYTEIRYVALSSSDSGYSVHKNAFTDISANVTTIGYVAQKATLAMYATSNWLGYTDSEGNTCSHVTALTSTMFEEGFWEGLANDSETVTALYGGATVQSAQGNKGSAVSNATYW